MEMRGSFITFCLIILLFAFSFVFSIEALSNFNTLYGIFAVAGFIVCILVSIYNGVIAGQNGEAIKNWYNIFTVISGIVFIWFLTRCGTAFGWW